MPRLPPGGTGYLKFAWTWVSRVIATLHVGAVPEHAPVQFTKRRPAAGVAASVTVVPWVNLAEQLLPQSIRVERTPDGVPITVPDPPRPIDTVKSGVNVAVTAIWSVTLSVQVGCVPLHAPLQPEKTPPPGVAVKVTALFCGTVAEQVPPQLIRPLAPVTVPLPTFVTVTDGTPTLAAAICAPT